LSQLTNSHHILSNNRNLDLETQIQISQTSSSQKLRQILKHATHFSLHFILSHTICDKKHFATSFIFTPVANVIVLETHPKNLTNITKMSRNPALELVMRWLESVRTDTM
jgi:hypothetical protein